MSLLDRRTHYIVAFYGGKRRGYPDASPVDLFANRHINFLASGPSNIVAATFILSKSNEGEVEEKLKDEVKKASLPIPLILRERENVGLSYGAWNDVLMDSHLDYDYSFLLEDDYLPNDPDFLDCFFDSESRGSKYVCSKAARYKGGKIHASVSNGLFNNKKAKKAIEDHGQIFKIHPITKGEYSPVNQVNFLDYLDGDISHAAKRASFEFIHKKTKVVGNRRKPIAIKPIRL